MQIFSNTRKGFFSRYTPGKPLMAKRILSLFAFGAFIRFLAKIPLPFLDYSLLPNSNRPSLLLLGIVPIVQASLLVQVFNMIKPKGDDDDFEKYQKIQKQIKILSTIISIVLSFAQVRSLSPYMSSYTLLSKIMLGSTLVLGGVIIAWISEVLSETFLMSGSVLVLTFTSVLDDVLRVVVDTLRLSLSLKFVCGIYLITVAAFTIVISKSVLEFPILTSKQSYSEQSRSSILPFSINPGAVMALVTAESLLRIGQLGFDKLNLISSTSPIVFILFSILRFVLLVSFSYYCSKLQVDSDKVSKDLMTMNMTILGTTPGEETQYYLERRLKATYLSAGLLLGLLVVITDIVDLYYPILSLKSNLSSLLILFGTMADLEDRLNVVGIEKSY